MLLCFLHPTSNFSQSFWNGSKERRKRIGVKGELWNGARYKSLKRDEGTTRTDGKLTVSKSDFFSASAALTVLAVSPITCLARLIKTASAAPPASRAGKLMRNDYLLLETMKFFAFSIEKFSSRLQNWMWILNVSTSSSSKFLRELNEWNILAIIVMLCLALIIMNPKWTQKILILLICFSITLDSRWILQLS